MSGHKMKIALITERFYPEEFIVNDLVSEWSKSGYEVYVLTQTPSYPLSRMYPGYKNRLLQTEYWGKIKIYRFFSILGYRNSLILKILNYINFVILGSVVSLFAGWKFDKVFVYQTGPLTQALPGVLIKKLYRKELTVWTQDLWPDSVYSYGFRNTWILRLFLNCLVKYVYRNCKNIFVSCRGFIDKIHLIVPDKKIHYFPNWPLFSFIKPENQVTPFPDRFNFTFAGNIGKVQNLENVLKGFSLAVQQNKNIQLNIIGDGSRLEYLKKLAQSEKIENISFYGRKSSKEMPFYFHHSDVLIISLKDTPLFRLTVPSKFQTYLAVQKPVFCIMKGEVKDLVDSNHLGITAEPEVVNEIRDGFIKFFNMSENDLKSYSENSALLLKTRFNRDQIIRSMLALISGCENE